MTATAASGHQATPRTAYVPMRKNTPSQARAGQAVICPRRAMSATTASAEAKNRIPCTSRSEVGCHSVIRWVTCGLIERPIAYAQTAGPVGVRQAASALTRATARTRRAPGSRSWTSSSQARPRTTGPRKKLPCRLAQSTTRNGMAHRRPGCVRRSTTRSSTIAKSAMPKSCGRRASVTAATTNAASVSHAARRSPSPRCRPMTNRQPKIDPDQRRPQEGQPRPAERLVDGGEDDLGAPLLVDPRGARGAERPAVDAGERPRLEDLPAGAEVVREVDRRQARQQRRQDRQGDGEECPETRQGHPRILGGGGAPSHRGEGPGRGSVTKVPRAAISRRPRPRTGGRRGRPRRRWSRWPRP